jgi:hypothetical protein
MLIDDLRALATSKQALSSTTNVGLNSSKAVPNGITAEMVAANNASGRALKRKLSAKQPFKPKKKRKKGPLKTGGSLKMDASALYQNDSFGIRDLDWDATRTDSWALFATGGAFTWPHTDAAGLVTFVVCKKGTKIWSYLVPKEQQKDPLKWYHEMVENCRDEEYLAAHATPMNLVLTPGSIV